MKRFTLLLTLTLVDLPWGTTLALQSPDSVSRDSSNHAIAFGYFATLGANWQIEAVEIGYVRHPNRGPAALAIAGRLGTFMEESAVMSASRGAVFAVTVSVRTHMRQISELGNEERPIPIGLDLTLEATGYLASSSPLLQGANWFAVGVLPSLRAGRLAITLGPTLFFGSQKASVRSVLAIRGEQPLGRRGRSPNR
jgi:hypothetical protein